MEVADWISRTIRGRSLASAVPDDVQVYDEMEPSEFLLAARLAVVGLSLATVILTGILASRLAGRAAGFAAALLAALAPALVLRGSVATVDPWATFFVLLALTLTDVSRTSRRPGLASLGAGAMAGCAFASKYPAIIVIIAHVVTTLVESLPVKEKIRRLSLAFLGLIVAAPIAMPALLFHTRDVVAAVLEQGRQYSVLASPALWRQAFVRAEWDHPYEHPELGVAFVLMAAGGLVLGLRTRRIAPTIWGWCALIAVSVALYGTRSYQPFRNMLPLVPLACVAVSFLYAKLENLLGRPHLVAIAGVIWILASFGVPLTMFVSARARLVDSRVRAIDWLAEHARRGDTGIVVRELGILRQEVRRVPAWIGPRWSMLAPQAIADHKPRWLVVGVVDHPGAPVVQVGELPEVKWAYEVRFRTGKRSAPGDRGGWRGNDQMISVLERKR